MEWMGGCGRVKQSMFESCMRACSTAAGGIGRVAQEAIFDFYLMDMQSNDKRRRLI